MPVRVIHLALLALLGLTGVLPAATAQVPGAYPHLVLDDMAGLQVPGAGGPFDSSGLFEVGAGTTFQGRISYAALGQPNTNVPWALLVSAVQTPFPTNLVPPPLFTLPPLILVLPKTPNLDATGQGSFPLHIPAGLWDTVSYVQGIVFDASNAPALQLSNGVTVRTTVPSFNASFSFSRDDTEPDPTDPAGALRGLGLVDLDASTLGSLVPLGAQAAPVATSGPTGDGLASFRCLPVLSNRSDAPINPRASPVTTLTAALDAVVTTIPVGDTSGFPSQGEILLSVKGTNLWAEAGQGGLAPPNVEVVRYSDLTPTAFVGCERVSLGSKGNNFGHDLGDVVLGRFSMVTGAGARARSRVSLDARNRDMVHLVIPAFTFDGGEGVGIVTRDLDLYRVEQQGSGAQAFVVLDRVTQQWSMLDSSSVSPVLGEWDPMVHVSPDHRFFIAALRTRGGSQGWAHNADQVWAFRLDGLDWPATGSPSWQISYTSQPPSPGVDNVRTRRVWMPCVAVVGSDPDNYVLYAGLANKWKQSSNGGGKLADEGFEGAYVRLELLVTDLIEVPLTPPGSTKTVPTLPAGFITTEFGVNDFTGDPILRFDPEVMVSDDASMLVVTAGSAEDEEDVFSLRNIVVQQDGSVVRILANLTGFVKTPASVDRKQRLRTFGPGAHGPGMRAAISPGQTRVAFLAWDLKSTFQKSRRDWLQVAATNGADIHNVGYTYADSTNVFQETGDYRNKQRTISGIQFLDEDRLLFFMGQAPNDRPLDDKPLMDLFLYDIPSDLMTNLTRTTDATGTGFAIFGNIEPTATFLSPNRQFAYFVRGGGSGLGSTLPLDTPVMNVVGVHAATGNLFDVTGQEFGGVSIIPQLQLAQDELIVPLETPFALQMTEGSGVQQGMLYLVAHRVEGGQGADDLFTFNMNAPFVAFQVAQTDLPGVHLSNVEPDAFSGKVAFARTDSTDALANDQHPFVVDLDNFMFERDLTPALLVGGSFIGRVMDGSFHFIPPSGSAPDGLVFSFGFQTTPMGIAHVCTPVYYSLGSVSNLLIEPDPVLVPLVDVSLLGQDFRYYVPSASTSLAPAP